MLNFINSKLTKMTGKDKHIGEDQEFIMYFIGYSIRP